MASSMISTTDWFRVLRSTSVPALGPLGLDAGEASIALDHVARLRGELARLQAELVARLETETRRDTLAALSRQLGLTAREAREAAAASVVLAAHPDLANALATGAVQAGHLAAVQSVDADDQAALLALAPSQPVDDFRNTVKQFRIAKAGPSWRDRERAARSVTFFEAKNGCLGLRAILPGIDGARLRGRLTDIVNAAYRANHPERADVRGGHKVDALEQRYADALMAMCDGCSDGDSSGSSGSSGRASVVVVVDPQRCEAEVLGFGPIPFDDAVELAADEARAEIFGIMQDTSGAVLKFGRNRRFATALQRLAIAVRDRRCVVAGCNRPATECDAHHEPPFDNGGLTNVDTMEARCSLHHAHRHETGATGPRRSAEHGPPNARSPDLDQSTEAA